MCRMGTARWLGLVQVRTIDYVVRVETVMVSSDDGTQLRWSQEGECLGSFQEPWQNTSAKNNDTEMNQMFILDAQWAPVMGKSAGTATMDTAAFTTSSGKWKLLKMDNFLLGKVFLCSKGRVEKIVEAHKGAVLAVRWSPDGSAFATGKKLRMNTFNSF